MHFLDKRFFTNLIATLIIFVGLWLSDEFWSNFFFNSGLFALSGALTNWLAIYMLFERVPGIYGSGVIPLNFESFKNSIHELIMNQFFSTDILKKYFSETESLEIVPNLEKVFQGVNFDPVFDSLLEVIEKSSLGSILSMVGGTKALEPLREPFNDKLKIAIEKISESDQFKDSFRKQFTNNEFSEKISKELDGIIKNRLEKLTPDMVKGIIERIIHKHLGWLVVWGGVFGGTIGIIKTLIILE